MGIMFTNPNSRLPGLNFDAPPGVRDLEYLFDTIFADEQRNRTQLQMGFYRSAGSSYGIVDEFNPNSATVYSGRRLVVQSNAGNPLTVDVTTGIAVTQSGNIIVVSEQAYGINLANAAVVSNQDTTSTGLQGTENVVLLEYLVVDDTSTNTVTDFNTVEAVRRKVGMTIDPQYSPTDPDITKQQLIKVVTVQDYLDPSKFSALRLSECVVLAIVKVVPNPDPVTYATKPTILSIDMTNSVNTWVRPWFTTVDQQHRSLVGTGSPTVPHALSYNDLGGGALTLYQQMLQHGTIISRDLDVPGCPGTICTEFVDGTRVLTDDASGTITGTANRRYVTLNSYPNRILGVRANITDGGTGYLVDTSVTAVPLAADLIPGTNILALWRQGATDEYYSSTIGFTVYYTNSDCLRPPALPHDLMLVANDIIQFQSPLGTEEYVTGGKIFNELPTTQYAVGTNGPMPKNYTIMVDSTQQFIESPQVVSCAKLINSPDVGTAFQTPQYQMYGPGRLRVALWNASAGPVGPTFDVQVELAGKDTAGNVVVETLIFSGTAGSPNPVVWDQTTKRYNEYVNTMQVTQNVFSQLDTWRIIPSPVGLGPNALIQLWADIEPTTTPALDDALPVCSIYWDGAKVASVHDVRPVTRNLKDAIDVESEHEHLGTLAESVKIALTAQVVVATPVDEDTFDVIAESFKSPKLQDNVLSKRNRHNGSLNTVLADETLLAFNSDGTNPGREWYYSNAIPLDATQDKLFMVLFGSMSHSIGNFNSSDGEAIVQYQLFTTPTAGGAWTTPTTVGNKRYRKITGLTGNFKIRFRIAGKRLSGFLLVATA